MSVSVRGLWESLARRRLVYFQIFLTFVCLFGWVHAVRGLRFVWKILSVFWPNLVNTIVAIHNCVKLNFEKSYFPSDSHSHLHVQVYPICLRVNHSLAFGLFTTEVFQLFSMLRNKEKQT